MYIMNNKNKHYIKDFKRKLVSGNVFPMYATSLNEAYDFANKDEALTYLSKIKDFDINDWEFKNNYVECDYCSKRLCGEDRVVYIEQNNMLFCSYDCCEKWMMDNLVEKQNYISCHFCGEPINTNNEVISYQNNCFCSDECCKDWLFGHLVCRQPAYCFVGNED